MHEPSHYIIGESRCMKNDMMSRQVVALHVGERCAEMLEIPNVLLATIIGVRWVDDRFTLPPLPGLRLSIGFVALISCSSRKARSYFPSMASRLPSTSLATILSWE